MIYLGSAEVEVHKDAKSISLLWDAQDLALARLERGDSFAGIGKVEGPETCDSWASLCFLLCASCATHTNLHIHPHG